MSNEANKRQRRGEVSRLLREAGEALAKAGGKLTTAADALAALETARGRLGKAAEWAAPTKIAAIPDIGYDGKTKKDGLPASIRTAIERETKHLTELAERVKALPVNGDEALLQQRAAAGAPVKQRRVRRQVA